MNLLKETMSVLDRHGKSIGDIVWVGCSDFKISMDQFLDLSNKTYDDGYGTQEVARDLIVCGSDFWLERHEYDGSEWWEFKTLPKEPKETRKVTRVTGDYSEKLSEYLEGE